MKARYLLELDPLASVESNLKFLDKCEEDLKAKRKLWKERQKPTPKNQIDLMESIKEQEHGESNQKE